MNDLVEVGGPTADVVVATRPGSLFNMNPTETILYAKEIAIPLADVIEKQQLFVNIQGKKYVKVEGWTTLGALLGIVPRETNVTRLEDGSYEAHVDLINFTTGRIVGGASALCSVDEKRWGGADDFARRSMAITRATGKAFRLGFSWIMTLAGYQPTPAEEMPVADAPTKSVQKINYRTYDGSADMADRIKEKLKERNIPKDIWPLIDDGMKNKPLSNSQLDAVIKGVMHGNV